MTPKEFVVLWNSCSNATDVANVTGQTKQGAVVKASRLRKQGWQLKKMPFHKTRTIEERFWEKVNKDGDCWLWTGYTLAKGYGLLSRGRRSESPIQAHRFSYELHKGPIPAGLCVLHTCDNPGCVNPDHLFLGNEADNTHDMIEKQRGHWQRNAPHRKAGVELSLAPPPEPAPGPEAEDDSIW